MRKVILRLILFTALLVVAAVGISYAQDVPGTVKYPTALDSAASLMESANRASSTLNGAITSGDTSLVLISAALFPNSGPVSIDNEILFYTGKSSNTLTGLQRGQDGTAAAAHSGGVTVSLRIVARHHSVISDVVRALEAKLGIGSSTAITNSLLAGTSAGVTGFTTTPTIDRLTIGVGTPIYDLGTSNELSVGQLIPHPSTVTVAAGKVYTGLRFSRINGSPNLFTVGASSAVAAGFASYVSSESGSDASSAVYAFIISATNKGPGTVKSLHASAFGSGTSNGVITAGNFQCEPVATTNTGSAICQFSSTSSGINDVLMGLHITSTDRLTIGIGSVVAPLPIQHAYYRAWMATASSANARAFQVLNNGGTELGYIHKDGTALLAGLSLTAALTVANGGSGAATLTGLLQGNGTGAFTAISNSSTVGQVLRVTGSSTYGWGALDLADTDAVTGALPQSNVANLGLVLIQTQDVSAVGQVDFTGLDNTYDSYLLKIDSAKPSVDDADEAWIRVGTGGGPSYQTSGYYWTWTAAVATVVTNEGSGSDAKIRMSQATGASTAVGSAAGENFRGEVRFSNPEASDFCLIDFDASYTRADNHRLRTAGTGLLNSAGAITAIRFMFHTGNATGRFTLYGYRKS